ncbi:Bug family tripartite tricarboxylate transporter substrate binding protein [Ottowia thiooxydans]|uniref:Bug family tripartite tricarboxylate transporter substrate binding protein n=1 Tax=Ottowia thiooxydans TaxID=219182 RepID=UPI000404A994|nr:tripartite tricarboxylate transporter substrate binding protein [Ottowia thiooxydans]
MNAAGLTHWLKATLALCAAVVSVAPTFAQEWPTRTVTLVVPYPPGGNVDNLARLLATEFTRKIGGTFIIDNKPGGTGLVGTNLVARSKPDGYTLLMGSYSTFATLPALSKMDPEPLDTIDVVAGIAGYIPVLAVSKQLGVKNMQELIALAKREPGKLTFGSVGVGSSSHVNGETLKHAAGIDMLHVPFKGSSQGVTALIGGQIDVVIDGVTVAPAQGDRVVPLAAFYKSRHEVLPNVPTAQEAGVTARLPTSTTFGMFAPKGTPPAIVTKLQNALEEITKDSAFKSKVVAMSLSSDYTPAAEYRKALEVDLKYNRVFLPSIGLTAEK